MMPKFGPIAARRVEASKHWLRFRALFLAVLEVGVDGEAHRTATKVNILGCSARKHYPRVAAFASAVVDAAQLQLEIQKEAVRG
jgi:hypothetical protein